MTPSFELGRGGGMREKEKKYDIVFIFSHLYKLLFIKNEDHGKERVESNLYKGHGILIIFTITCNYF